MVLELLFEYGEHESSSVAQILNVVPNIDPAFELESLMSSSVAQDLSSRVVTRARIGFRARVTYFELGCPAWFHAIFYSTRSKSLFRYANNCTVFSKCTLDKLSIIFSFFI